MRKFGSLLTRAIALPLVLSGLSACHTAQAQPLTPADVASVRALRFKDPYEAKAPLYLAVSRLQASDAPDLALPIIEVQARLMLLVGNSDIAIKLLTASLPWAKATGQRASAANLSNLLAAANYYETSNLNAVKDSLKATAELESLGDIDRLTEALALQALVCREASMISQTVRTLKQLRRLAKKEESIFWADYALVQGGLYEAIGDLNLAKQLLIEGADFARRQNNLWLESNFMYQLGLLERSGKNFQEAIALFKPALDIAIKQNDTFSNVITSIRLGESYADIQRCDIADEYFKNAESKLSLLETGEWVMRISLSQTQCLLGNKQTTQANEKLLALDRFKDQLRDNNLIRYLYLKAQTAEQQGRSADAYALMMQHNKEQTRWLGTQEAERRRVIREVLNDAEQERQDQETRLTNEKAAAQTKQLRLLYLITGLAILLALVTLSFAVWQRVQAKRFRTISETDSLTKVKSRLAFEAACNTALENFSRYSVPVSLLIFDVDGFKPFNDTYGHRAGDQALKDLTRTVRIAMVRFAKSRDGLHGALGLEQSLLPKLNFEDSASLSDTNFVHSTAMTLSTQGSGADGGRVQPMLGRIGGDEFVLLLKRGTETQIRLLADQVLEAVRQMKWKQSDMQLTISIGMSTATEAGDTFDELYRRADMALYSAKSQGRNNAIHYTDQSQAVIGQVNIP